MRIKQVSIYIFILLLMAVSIPVYHVLNTKWKEKAVPGNLVSGYANDASQLNLTKVDTIIAVPAGKDEMVFQLKRVLEYAKHKELKISISGAQHSMGGHTIYPNGIVLNMLPYNHMKLDTSTNILSIGSGALWEHALQYLDSFNKSVAIMQAFSSFSIGGSLSVNGHGWQKEQPPGVSQCRIFYPYA